MQMSNTLLPHVIKNSYFGRAEEHQLAGHRRSMMHKSRESPRAETDYLLVPILELHDVWQV